LPLKLVCSPAIAMPQRYKGEYIFQESRTYRPPRKLECAGCSSNFSRIFTFSTLFIVLASLIITANRYSSGLYHIKTLVICFCPLLYAGAGLLGIGITVLLKWLVAGRYRPQERPLWSTFVWRNDLITPFIPIFASIFS